MALSNAQIAKQLANQLNDTRGLLGRTNLKHAAYSSGASFTVVTRTGETKTVTVS